MLSKSSLADCNSSMVWAACIRDCTRKYIITRLESDWASLENEKQHFLVKQKQSKLVKYWLKWGIFTIWSCWVRICVITQLIHFAPADLVKSQPSHVQTRLLAVYCTLCYTVQYTVQSPVPGPDCSSPAQQTRGKKQSVWAQSAVDSCTPSLQCTAHQQAQE